MYKVIIILFLLFYSLDAYETEDKVKVIIVGKVAKFIRWEDNTHKKFIITILKNPFDGLFNTIYDGKKIHKKYVEIKYIDNIDNLSYTDILYLPKISSDELKKIFQKIDGKKILSMSDMRSFAQKGGMVQISFASQRARLKINIDSTNKSKLQVKASLLKISDVIGEINNENI